MAEYLRGLSPDQAFALAEMHNFTASPNATRHALSGPAGSGKTFLIAQFIGETARKVRLTATTNKAAAVAARMAPGREPMTIHSLLGLQPEADTRRGRMVLKRKRDPKVARGELVIVDEASMVDSELLAVIDDDAKRIGFRVLFVGDAYQLPPIFESVSPAFDKVRTSHLTTVHRQALDNPLIATATGFRRVLDGKPFPVIETRGKGVLCVETAQFDALTMAAFDSADYQSDPDFCRALAWTNARVGELNKAIRRHLLGAVADRHPFIPGEQVIVNEAVADDDELLLPTEARVTVIAADRSRITDNDTGITVDGHRVEVISGDTRARLFVADSRQAVGALLEVYARKAKALQTEADQARKAGAPWEAIDQDRRAAWRQFFDTKRQFADLRPPHASTVHKSQGSTYQHAFIDIGDIGRCTRADLVARLAYVALTRPAQSAVIVGDLPARLYRREVA